MELIADGKPELALKKSLQISRRIHPQRRQKHQSLLRGNSGKNKHYRQSKSQAKPPLLKNQVWRGQPFSVVCDHERMEISPAVRITSVEIVLDSKKRVFGLTNRDSVKSEDTETWSFAPYGFWYNHWFWNRHNVHPFSLYIDVPEMWNDTVMKCFVSYTDAFGHFGTAFKSAELGNITGHPYGKDNPCKENWMKLGSPGLPPCMKTFHQNRPWQDANEYCKSYHGGHLAVIEDKNYDYIIHTLVGTTQHWLGMRYDEDSAMYDWVENPSQASSLSVKVIGDHVLELQPALS
ncbi:hypothetical protein PoB_003350800 [Plakobranchus ocellatus]|uniref:C-type lectin domain-containing protein n=1 Tax=Plakobranchus ocellatus TaxID=259542 RepID=A0AAV4AKF4_9GAST|nr:hypothetical protein PoB_003350800 [Plakobranchus ocellatus]